ncbi:tetratricopeptide repeat protein [Rubripirellula reticaptiva]|uniref:Tetratricopeptide repeat protein n=1 Tax=Rubripirellula reticaptiva TaxID=2528013 RepID=A0A5C6F2P4_9BACT|nr:tetratricopeptide repeat protein [Rubripirellula reticaptiva]TWU55472.1 Tetratricopeptide repeat protein [Rubripirellula reticaptiva]
MPDFPASDSGIQVSQSPKESHGGRQGKWEAVLPEELDRVSIEEPVANQPVVDEPVSVSATEKTSVVDESVTPPPVVVETAKSVVAETTETTETTNKPKLELKRRQYLEHHLKSNPADLDAFLELAKIYRAENRPVEARRVLQQAIQIFPDEHELHWELEEATLSRSIQQLREVAELDSRLKTTETDHELTRCQQDWALRRIEVCQARLSRDPSLVNLRITLAEARYDSGDYQDAIEELDPVLDNDELSPSAYLIRGKCLLALGKDLDAMVALRACALRRAVVAPVRLRVIALRLLCETADRLGVSLTLASYQASLQQAEQELAKQTTMGA